MPVFFKQPDESTSFLPTPSPGFVRWVNDESRSSTVDIPPGLEDLSQIDRIIIEQRVDLTEMGFGFQGRNEYTIYDQEGEQIFYAFEESEACCRFCLGNKRGYKIRILDNSRREVLKIRRPFKCCGSIFKSHKTTIEAQGQVIGTVKQKFSLCRTNFVVYDAHKKPQLQIEGPNQCSLNFCCPCSDKIFKVRTLKGKKIGVISKKYNELGAELFTDADTFTVNFPPDLDVLAKAALLGATFLIDFLCFEDDTKCRI